MKTPITPVRAAAPKTIEELAREGYAVYAKERHRLGDTTVTEWAELPRADSKAWAQAASTIAALVAFGGCPRPMDPTGDTREVSRCAEWLLHIADGGDAGSEAQLRMLLRTAAGLLVRPITPGGGQPQPASKTFDELPLATSAPSIEERAKWINVLDPLLKYAGRPGDWGRESKLGLLTQRLLQVRQELAQGEIQEGSSA